MRNWLIQVLGEQRRIPLDPGAGLRYGVATLAVAVAVGVRFALDSIVGRYSPYLPFMIAVIVAARFGGRVPGFVSTALSAFGSLFFINEPRFPVLVADRDPAVGLTLFIVVGCIISLLVGHQHECLLSITRAEERLRFRKRLIDLSHDAIVTMDSSRHITGWNRGAEEMYGWTENEAMGKIAHELLRASGPMLNTQIEEILHREGRWDGELNHQARDGRRVVVESRQVLLLNDRNDPEGALEINRDITERKQTEERLRQTQKFESIGVLAGGIAHDFNNLLTVIMGNASLALADYPSFRHYQEIYSAAERAAHLTNQLLAYAGKSHTVVKVLNLTELLTQMSALLSTSVPKRVNFKLRPTKDQLCLEADPSQIEQMVLNLVINSGEAIPAKRDGLIEVTTSICEVTPDILRQNSKADDLAPGPYVCVEVRDNGCGMDEPTLSRMFDPFFSTKFPGRGLGLAAVHGIVRVSRGFIDVQSSVGEGTSFRVFLPASQKTCAVESAPSASAKVGLVSSTTVLVVDDEEMVRNLACKTLRLSGYEVLEAANGKDALRVLANADPVPSIVVLDLAMPVMGGDELVPILQTRYPDVKIVLTSGYPREQACQGFSCESVSAFLQKPYTIVALAETVGEALDRRALDR